MNIIAFNSSPRSNDISKTELVLNSFLKGARRAGAVTDTFYLRNYKIHDCLGCYNCWLTSPGRCVQQDDMAELLHSHYLEADLVILATPIYHATMNARMKTFVERTMPLLDPLAMDSGHPYRHEKVPRIAALSVCGSWEPDTFKALSLTLRMIFQNYLVAEIYRHSSEFLTFPIFQAQMDEVLDAVAQAGEELVREGAVSPKTMTVITRELASPEVLAGMARERFQGN